MEILLKILIVTNMITIYIATRLHVSNKKKEYFLSALKKNCKFISDPKDNCGWMPIETAPKKGKILLVAPWLMKDDPPTQVAYGRWYSGDKPCWVYDGYSFSTPNHQPTHWMPLPEPPKEK